MTFYLSASPCHWVSSPRQLSADALVWASNHIMDFAGRNLVLVDMDGTLADVSDRLHWVRGSRKKNWKKFFNEMSKDPPNPVVLEWVQNLVPEYRIVIVSGRPEDYRQATIDWLRRYKVPFSGLYM